MYQAKQKGKNTFEFYTKSLTQICVERMNMEVRLRHAIEQRELTLYYQPKLETGSGRLVGAEALLRWDSPELGSVDPVKFIDLAEETGLIIPIGEWVLREACRQMQEWKLLGLPPISVAVNVSARQFQHGDISQLVDSLLRETGLSPHCLELELTESAIMKDEAKEIAQRLSRRGVRLSVDDFGTGYSFSQLRVFRKGSSGVHLDALKIDQSFVQDLPHDEDASAITQAIIAMAHGLGTRVVAEGVETQQQFSFLQEHGCDEVQGFLFSRPLPASEFVRLFANGSADLPPRFPVVHAQQTA